MPKGDKMTITLAHWIFATEGEWCRLLEKDFYNFLSRGNDGVCVFSWNWTNPWKFISQQLNGVPFYIYFYHSEKREINEEKKGKIFYRVRCIGYTQDHQHAILHSPDIVNFAESEDQAKVYFFVDTIDRIRRIDGKHVRLDDFTHTNPEIIWLPGAIRTTLGHVTLDVELKIIRRTGMIA